MKHLASCVVNSDAIFYFPDSLALQLSCEYICNESHPLQLTAATRKNYWLSFGKVW